MHAGHLRGNIAADLLAPPARERFDAIFAVAGRKSVFQWHATPYAQADLVLVDGSAQPGAPGLAAPCLVCLGEPAQAAPSAAPWQARLPASYTVAELIDVLDRAAVFLLDWQARQGGQRSSAAPAAPAAPAASAPAAPVSAPAPVALYRLGSWVSMGAPFNTHGCLRALALLAQGAVTARQISMHSGLEPARTTALLGALQQRGVLVVSSRAALPAQAPAHPVRAVPAALPSLVQRLSHWLKGAAGQRA